MNYYKIIKDQTFIGVISSNNFRRYNRRQQFLGPATENDGELIDYMGIYYRDTWMAPIIDTIPYLYLDATVLTITQEEYEELNVLLEEDYEQTVYNENLALQLSEELPQEDNTNFYDNITIEEMKKLKLQQLSTQCRTTIENGFDLELRGEIHHFSLTTQDQLNLMSLGVMVQTQSLIPYHADGEECTFYSAEEINTIINESNTFKNYHISYYNSLKTYINTLDTIEAIAAITYGTPIPDEYKSDVLMVLE